MAFYSMTHKWSQLCCSPESIFRLHFIYLPSRGLLTGWCVQRAEALTCWDVWSAGWSTAALKNILWYSLYTWTSWHFWILSQHTHTQDMHTLARTSTTYDWKIQCKHICMCKCKQINICSHTQIKLLHSSHDTCKVWTCMHTHTQHSHLSDSSPPCALAVVDIIQSADWLNLLPPYYKTQRPMMKRTQKHNK